MKKSHTTTPLAVGEVFNVVHDCQQLIQEQLIDYIRTTVVHDGGIFFFSSRRRHTRCGRDWSSDVCSSDLHTGLVVVGEMGGSDRQERLALGDTPNMAV